MPPKSKSNSKTLKQPKAPIAVEAVAPVVEPSPVVEVTTPPPSPVLPVEDLGVLGGRKIIKVTPNKKHIGGKNYHEYITADLVTYLLNDHDVEEQVGK